jgi:hypothetical protein
MMTLLMLGAFVSFLFTGNPWTLGAILLVGFCMDKEEKAVVPTKPREKPIEYHMTTPAELARLRAASPSINYAPGFGPNLSFRGAFANRV